MTDTTRRAFMMAVAAAAAAAGCAPPARPDPVATCAAPSLGAAGPLAPPGSAGLIDETVFRGRCADYLAHATTSIDPNNPTSVAAHLIRAAQDPSFVWDPSIVTVASMQETWDFLDGWNDTGDFRVMYLHWLLHLGPGVLDPAVLARIEDQLTTFRYRYDDPLPADRVDDKWFWSENHRLIFLVDEYLAGAALPDRIFVVTGLTGAQHAARARPGIIEWIRERGKFGFSEFHSAVYMLKNISPLLTLIEIADDVELQQLGAVCLDLCCFDMATHLQRGSYAAAQGRTYKKDKTKAADQGTFDTAKLLFDDTALGWDSRSDGGATYLSAAQRYRVPEALVRVARSEHVGVVRERHGIDIDPHEELNLSPSAPYGYDYADPANLEFWWSQGALTAWQVVPVTLAAAKRWRLWDTELFKEFGALSALADVPPSLAQIGARELASMAAFGVLGEAHTYTWRSPDVMMSTAVDHRFGDAMQQSHAWQATLDETAQIFTTHPLKPVAASTDWSDDSGYWTGTASMPRSVQRDRTSIHIYWPAYDAPTDDLLGPAFGYLKETHAFFPRQRFDEIVEAGHWVFGRKGDGYVGLWSYRSTEWRIYDPTVNATDGMTEPFDLVAPGGADNVWICEVGRRADDGAFAEFVARVSAATIDVDRPNGAEYRVRYESPSAGVVEWGPWGPVIVDGVASEVRDHPRHSSHWAEVCHLGEWLEVVEGGSRLAIDVRTGARVVSSSG